MYLCRVGIGITGPLYSPEDLPYQLREHALMLEGLVNFIETEVRIPLWLFLLVASKLGYDVVAMFGLFGVS